MNIIIVGSISIIVNVLNLLIDLFFSLSTYLKFSIVHFVSINHCLFSSFSLSIEMQEYYGYNDRNMRL